MLVVFLYERSFVVKSGVAETAVENASVFRTMDVPGGVSIDDRKTVKRDRRVVFILFTRGIVSERKNSQWRKK